MSGHLFTRSTGKQQRPDRATGGFTHTDAFREKLALKFFP